MFKNWLSTVSTKGIIDAKFIILGLLLKHGEKKWIYWQYLDMICDPL